MQHWELIITDPSVNPENKKTILWHVHGLFVLVITSPQVLTEHPDIMISETG